MRHRKNLRGWRPAPKAWAYRTGLSFPKLRGKSYSAVMKELYPQARIPKAGEKLLETPRWAVLAFARHWMTQQAFYDTPKEWLGRTTVGYEDSPLYGLLKKRGLATRETFRDGRWQ